LFLIKCKYQRLINLFSQPFQFHFYPSSNAFVGLVALICSECSIKFLTVYFSSRFIWGLGAVFDGYIRLTLFAINCPKIKNGNQSIWTSIVKIGICINAGPGHKPPIPQPKPKQAAPPTNFQSMTLLTGLKSFYPKKDNFLTLSM